MREPPAPSPGWPVSSPPHRELPRLGRPFRWPFQSVGKALPQEAVAAAWAEWQATRSPVARETLVQRYIHLVRYMAGRLSRALPPSIEIDDLVSAGAVGFVSALDSFDPSHGVDFSVYALTRIRGAMVDFVREIDPVGRITRRRLRAVDPSLSRYGHRFDPLKSNGPPLGTPPLRRSVASAMRLP